MSETLSNITPESARIISEQELMQLGGAVLEAAQRSDLEQVVAEHASIIDNPNSAGAGLFVAGEVPMSDDKAYRQVGLEAVQDLADSGIVRNGTTGRSEDHRRWGHKVFWNAGKSDAAISTGGRFVIEAPLEAVREGWVSADKVTGVYTKTPSGEVKNILEPVPPKAVASK